MIRSPIYRPRALCRMVLTLILAVTVAPSGAQTVGPPASAGEPLVVGTKIAPPFVMQDAQGNYSGIGIALWEAVADELDLEYRYKETTSEGLVTALANGRLEVAVAALTVTAARETRIDFSYPYFTTGLAIAVPADGRALWATIKHFLSWQLLMVLIGLTGALLIAGAAMWAFERRRNREEFGGSVAHGLGDGFWWAVVTMTTVGYGDKTPKTLGGRIIGFIWMFIAIIIISSLTASITSSLTVGKLASNVRGMGDLADVRVGTVADSASAAVLRRHGIGFSTYPQLAEALQALEHGQLDAVVYAAPTLRYTVLERHGNSLKVVKATLERHDYAFGLPQSSPLRERLNRAILRQLNSPAWEALLTRYLGAGRTPR